MRYAIEQLLPLLVLFVVAISPGQGQTPVITSADYVRLVKDPVYFGSLNDVQTFVANDNTGPPLNFVSKNWDVTPTSRSVFFWIKHTIPVTSNAVNILRVGSTRNNDQAVTDKHLLVSYNGRDSRKLIATTLVFSTAGVVDQSVFVNGGNDIQPYKWYAVYAAATQSTTFALYLYVYDSQTNSWFTLQSLTTLPIGFVATNHRTTLFVDYGGDLTKNYYCKCYLQDVRFYFNLAFNNTGNIKTIFEPEIELRLNLEFRERDNSIEMVEDLSPYGNLVYRGVSQYNDTNNPGLYYSISATGQQGHTYIVNQYDTISPAIELSGVFTVSFWCRFLLPAALNSTTDFTTQTIFYKQNSQYPTNYVKISVIAATSTVTNFIVDINGQTNSVVVSAAASRITAQWNLFAITFFRYPRNDTFVTTPFTLVSGYRFDVTANTRQALYSKSNISAVFYDGGLEDIMRIGAGPDPSADHFIGVLYNFKIFHGGNYRTISNSICGIRYGITNMYDTVSQAALFTLTCLDCQLTASSSFLTASNECVTTCPTGSPVTSDAMQICRDCAFNCETCTAGRKPNQCSSCTVGNLNTSASINCPDLPECSSNQYFLNNDCVTCEQPCTTCDNSSSTCTSCNRTTYYDSDFGCQALVCGDGIAVEGENCDDGNLADGDGCSSRCELENGFYCPTAGEACYSICGDGIRSATEQCDDRNNNNGDGCSWNCTVEAGFYCTSPTLNPNNKDTCTACPTNCALCTNATTCTSCTAGNYLQGTLCATSCAATEYIKNGTICQSCPPSCTGCTSDTECTGCSSPFFLEGASCVPSCSSGSYAKTSTRTCESCPTGCLECVSATNCTSCNSVGYYFDFTSWVCSTCDPTCMICSSGGPTGCVECPSGRVYKPDTSECVELNCLSTEYIDYSVGDCATCNSTCQNCNGPTAKDCLSCSTGSILITDNSCETCTVLNGFHPNCTEICGKGFRLTTQLSCDDGNTMNNDGCSSECVVEANWTCSGGGLSDPDTCRMTTTPRMTLKVSKRNTGIVRITFDRTMAITDTGDLTGELLINLASIDPTTYTWTAQFYNNSQGIRLNLHLPIDVLNSRLYVNLLYPTKFKDIYGNVAENETEIEFPNYYYYNNEIRSDTEKLERADYGFQGIIAAIMIPLWIAGAVQYMWGFIDYLQIVYLLLFINVNYPLNLDTFFNSFSYMHLLFLPNPFDLYPEDQVAGAANRRILTEKVPAKFEVHDYTANFLLNTGYILAAMAVAGLVLGAVVLLCRTGWDKPEWTKFIQGTRGVLQWNVIIRLYLLFFGMFALFTFLQLTRVTYSTAIDAAASTLSFIAVLLVLATPIFAHFLVRKWMPFAQILPKKRKMQDIEPPKNHLNTLTDEFNTTPFFKSAYIRILLIRKIAFAIILGGINASPYAQLVLLVLVMVTSMLTLILFRPYKTTFWNIRDLAQDFVVFLTLCLLFPYLDNDSTREFFVRNGWDIIILMYCPIVLNIAVLVWLSLKGWKVLLKKIFKAFRFCYVCVRSGSRKVANLSSKTKRTKIVIMTRKRRVLRRKAVGGYAAAEEQQDDDSEDDDNNQIEEFHPAYQSRMDYADEAQLDGLSPDQIFSPNPTSSLGHTKSEVSSHSSSPDQVKPREREGSESVRSPVSNSTGQRLITVPEEIFSGRDRSEEE